MTTEAADLSDAAAILLIAHGSRRADANQDLIGLARDLRAATGCRIVEASYLELAEPTIPQGAASCVEQGARRVLMAPYFLSAGTHVIRDLERYREELSQAYPGVRFHVCPPLGPHPLLVQILVERVADGWRASEK